MAASKSGKEKQDLKSRAKFLVKGIVQGVGFRPFIYNLAREHVLSGWVLNSTEGVSIEVEGESGVLTEFIRQVEEKAPPLAIFDSVDVSYLPPVNYETFTIKTSAEPRRVLLRTAIGGTGIVSMLAGELLTRIC